MGSALPSGQHLNTRGFLLLGSVLVVATAAAEFASAGDGSGVILSWLGVLAMLTFAALSIGWLHQSRRLHQSQDALREQNRRLDCTISNIAQAVCMFDAQERLVLCNERYAQMYELPPALTKPGTTLSALLQHRAGNGTLTGGPERFRRALLDDLAAGRGFRALVETSDGRTISVIGHPMAGGGWVATHEDITELRRAERDAQRAHATLREALEAIPDGVIIFDADGRLIMSNRRCDEIYPETADLLVPGVTFEDLLRRGVARGIHPEAIGREEEWLAERLSLVKMTRNVREQRMSDGRWMRVADCPTADGGFIGIRSDITELKQRQQELAVQNTRFSAAIGNISQGLIMFDAAERMVLCNRRYSEIYGLDPTLLRAGHTTLAELLALRKANGTFPGDPEDFRRRRVPAIVHGEGERRTIETRDGRTISIISQPMPDGSWVATHEDVTERRRAEQELARAEEFLDRVIENVPPAIIVKDPRTERYLLVNRAAEEFLGLTRQDIVGKTAFDLYPQANAEWIAERDREALRAGFELLSDEHPFMTARNGVRMVATRRLAVAGPDGQPEYLMIVIEDVTERKQAEARIAHMAHHDALTGLANRVRFHDRLKEALGGCARGASLAVICLDLDHFKSVNDTLGHSFGDELLKQVAKRLRACVPEDDLVARLGGDEFAVIQSSIRHPTEAALLVQRIGAAIKQPFEIGEHQVDIDVSIGISMAPTDAHEPDALLKNADLALYGAKGEGRGTYRFFQPEMDARMKARHQLDSDLRRALTSGELDLFYQPLVSLADQSIIGFEALLRWQHPERGMISPAQFIPVAEETGLIVPLGEWVLRQACAAAASWPEHLTLAVNLSPVQFRRNLLATVTSALAASGLSPHRLELEITEAALLHDDHATMSVLHQLRQLGMRIVMDDFGTGYSSLSYLRQFPFDKIKIDRSFIGDLSDQSSVSIVQAIVELATSLKMTTTAEGIETQEQLDRLRAVGCAQGQGYLFGRPARERDAIALVPTCRTVTAA
jgi:diguanylate cyclase (GGDEF)-like protein/PAS domain S-box-containing protein